MVRPLADHRLTLVPPAMADLPKIFEELLGLAVENGASDVHLKAGRPALMRVAGLAASPNPKAFEMNLSGISIQSGRIIQ